MSTHKTSSWTPSSRLTAHDELVLADLSAKRDDHVATAATIEALRELDDSTSDLYRPMIMTGYDLSARKDGVRHPMIERYIAWAESVVRHPADAVFVSHLLVYTILPISAVVLWRRFTTLHAIGHGLFALYCAGPFTLLMHNHLHQNGVLARQYAFVDQLMPYLLGPLLGHTFESYLNHHRYMHHTAGNGPEDLSSTLRYQRDSFSEWLFGYFADFFFNTWWKLPRFFWRRGRRALAVRALTMEVTSMALITYAVVLRPRPGFVLFALPVILLRIGLMLGNWGQHAFIDEIEPDSDLRSSITLIDIGSNRYCFNDGYHTSHHLNPRRHWREHPRALLQAKERYAEGRALVFRDIDFLMISVRLFRKDYDHLARRLVPLGDQRNMSHEDIVKMLIAKTQRFTEDDIAQKFGRNGH